MAPAVPTAPLRRKQNPNVGDAYGNYSMPARFGCELVYPVDQAPGNMQLGASFEGMGRLRVPDFLPATTRKPPHRGVCSGSRNGGPSRPAEHGHLAA